MESRVSSREANFDEFKKSQDEFRISQAKFRAEIKTTQDLILLQLKLLVEKLGVESSAATPTHQPFIKMASPISLVKSNQVVLKQQSFHEEKIRAREKVDEFWSQFRPKYKPKSPPCLRPILKKFKKVCDYGKHHDDDSANFRSNPKFQGSFGVFGKALARENETLFDLFNKKTEDSVMGSSVLDSDCMKSKIQACILGSAFLVSNVQELNFTDHGYKRVGSVKGRFKSPDFSISDGIFIDFPIRFDLGFILDAKQMLIPAAGVGVHLGHNVFDEMPHSTYNCVLQLGYHMPISDSGGTLITGHFTSKFQVIDAYNFKFLVCNGEFLKNGTKDLQDKIGLFVSNFCDKKSDESKIMAVGFVGFYLFMNSQPSILENEYRQELVGMYAHHVVIGMQQTVSIVSLNLGYHVSIRDKGGTNFLASFESIDLLASCKDSSFCVFINRSMGYYCKGIRDKGGTISHRLFNSKSKNKDCVLGSDCSKVVKCEVIFDSSMIIHGEYGGNLGLHHLEACMDKNRKNERKFTLSRFETGCCVVCYVVLDRDYCKGIQDKGGEKLDYGSKLFEKMRIQDIFSWTSIITTYVWTGQEDRAIKAFIRIQEAGVSLDEYTFAGVISRVANLARVEWGEQLHAHVLHRGLISLLLVGNSIVTMYAKCGRLVSGSKVFHEMSRRDIVSWSTLIAGYSQGRYGEETFQESHENLTLIASWVEVKGKEVT